MPPIRLLSTFCLAENERWSNPWHSHQGTRESGGNPLRTGGRTYIFHAYRLPSRESNPGTEREARGADSRLPGAVSVKQECEETPSIGTWVGKVMGVNRRSRRKPMQNRGRTYRLLTERRPSRESNSGDSCCETQQALPHHPAAPCVETADGTGQRQKPFQCFLCPYNTDHRSNLQRHLKTHTGERPYVCRECGKAFTQSSNLRKHRRTHSGERPYACIECGKAFAYRHTLRGHARTHSGERPHACSECGKTFADVTNLKRHERTHATGAASAEAPLGCDRGLLEPRRRTKRREATAETARTAEEKPHACFSCGEGFCRPAEFTQHAERRLPEGAGEEGCAADASDDDVDGSTDEVGASAGPAVALRAGAKPHVCRECAKSFANASGLRRHGRTHVGHRPHVCAACGKSFSQSGNLRAHERAHTGGRPHACRECGRAFSYPHALRRHARSAHATERPHRCTECGKAFSDFSYLKTHRRYHAGEKPHRCALCSKSFVQLGDLRRHEKIHARTETCK
uniref:Zinc finger protein 436-like isoform X2 n=1 Tax=Petromyzon marinus TaxID=7757 RepID=A0AAJ7SN61_PETMA|nr:zinc finger protein 436-like isoform X2 [Petromyzon marinus]